MFEIKSGYTLDIMSGRKKTWCCVTLLQLDPAGVSITKKIYTYPSTLPADLLLLPFQSCVVTVLLLPSHLPIGGPSLCGAPQTHLKHSYGGMKLPLHLLRALKDAHLLKNLTQILAVRRGSMRFLICV